MKANRKLEVDTTVSNPKDSNGVEIEPGDLVVSAGIVGRVKNINGWGSINVTYKLERNVYAHQEGAPDIEKECDKYGYVDPPAGSTSRYRAWEKVGTYMGTFKDNRVVGTKIVDVTQVRVNTSNIVVIRKAAGYVPVAVSAALDRHSLIFPAKEWIDAPDVG